MACPLATISKVMASSRKMVTIFQLYLALHSTWIDFQFLRTMWLISLRSWWWTSNCVVGCCIEAAEAAIMAAVADPRPLWWCVLLTLPRFTTKWLRSMWLLVDPAWGVRLSEVADCWPLKKHFQVIVVSVANFGNTVFKFVKSFKFWDLPVRVWSRCHQIHFICYHNHRYVCHVSRFVHLFPEGFDKAERWRNADIVD